MPERSIVASETDTQRSRLCAPQVEENGLVVNVTQVQVANETLDNSQNMMAHTYTQAAPMQQERYANWSRFPGVDAILTFSTVDAGLPAVAVSNDGRDLLGWVPLLSWLVLLGEPSRCIRGFGMECCRSIGLLFHPHFSLASVGRSRGFILISHWVWSLKGGSGSSWGRASIQKADAPQSYWWRLNERAHSRWLGVRNDIDMALRVKAQLGGM